MFSRKKEGSKMKMNEYKKRLERWVGCMWVGGLIWEVMCVCEGVGCLVGEKEGARGREGEK